MVPISSVLVMSSSSAAATTHERASANSACRHRQRDHHLHDGLASGRHPVTDRVEQGPHLHGVEARLHDGETDAADAEHRVGLRPVQRRPAQRAPRWVESPVVAAFSSRSSTWGRNSCSGGSSRRTVTGSPSMASRISTKSSCWTRRSSSSAAASSSGVVGPGSCRRTTGRRSAREEHVLGPAQPDALRPEPSGVGRVGAVVGVGPHTHPCPG